ncbi:Acetylcholinesterase-1 [Halotydeus destructor]|nr:Acetylcholinesterase-1 [Halotydeus destructor]
MMTTHAIQIFTIIIIATICCAIDYVDVTTKYGVIRGQRLLISGQQVNQFSGIPYARPPVGRLRFAKPVETLPWSPKVLDTTKHVLVYCYEGSSTKNENEDCLYLNVWSPVRADQSQLLPVYLYLNGGGFLQFGGTYDDFNSSYAVRYDFVTVFADVRTNIFGFLHGNRTDAPGNLGLWDDAMVIKWIAENIGAFGGDADSLTIAGVSSGCSLALVLAISPVTQRYIRRVICTSGSIVGHERSYIVAESRKIATSLGCDNKTNYIPCLRKLNSSTLYAAFDADTNSMVPYYGDEIFPTNMMPAMRQGKFNKSVPLLSGGSRLEYVDHFVKSCDDIATYLPTSNYSVTKALVKTCFLTIVSNTIADEMLSFYLKDVNQSDSDAMQVVATKAYGDFLFSCPTYFMSKIIASFRGSSDVFSIYYTYGTEVTVPYCEGLTWPRPCHDEERFGTFGAAYREPTEYNSTDRTYTDQLIGIWTTFGRTGRPPTMGGYRWPAYQDPPLAPITPINLGKNETQLWPSYLEVNPLRAQRAPVYKPYPNCDEFWSKHMELFNSAPSN